MQEEELVRAQILSVVRIEQGNAVLIKPESSDLAVPIFVGQLEAHSILIGLGEVPMPRPLTHDLMLGLLAGVETKVDHIKITDLQQDTFYAKIFLRRKDALIELDSRPSDALGLAVRVKCPIFIAARIVQEAGISIEFMQDEEGSEPNPVELERTRLRAELDRAIEIENYEEAAHLRDSLRDLEKN